MKVTPIFFENSAKMRDIVSKNPSRYPNALFLFSNKQLPQDAFSYLDNVDKKNTAKILNGILASMDKEVFDSQKLEPTLAFLEDIFTKMRLIASREGRG